MGVMTMKRHSTFPKAPALMGPHPSDCLVLYPRHLLWVLLLCRDSIGVFTALATTFGMFFMCFFSLKLDKSIAYMLMNRLTSFEMRVIRFSSLVVKTTSLCSKEHLHTIKCLTSLRLSVICALRFEKSSEMIHSKRQCQSRWWCSIKRQQLYPLRCSDYNPISIVFLNKSIYD